MKNIHIGIFLSVLLAASLSSCDEQKVKTRLVLNEVLLDN